MDNKDLIYAAGFFDGEGSVIISKTRQYRYLRVIVGNTNKEVVDWFGELFGGSVGNGHKSGLGSKLLYMWQLNGVGAARFLELVEPYLKVKKAHAILAIQFQKCIQLPGFNHGSADLELQDYFGSLIKELNHA